MTTATLVWEGNTNCIVVEGTFIRAAGKCTSVVFAFQAKLGDGRFEPGSLEFFAPTVKHFSLPPGSHYQFSADGPEGLAWEVRARVEPEPPRPPKEPTLEQRLAALEQSNQAAAESAANIKH